MAGEAGGGALREIFAEFGVEFDDEELQRGGRSVGGVIGRIRELGQLLVANEIVSGLREFAAQFEEQAGRVQDTADSLGMATDELQRLQYAATQGGVGADQLTAALATLQRNAAAAAHGGGTAASVFRELGVELRDADGTTRSASDLLGDLAVNLDRIEDPARRTAMAQQVLGESGRRLLTILHGGEGGLAGWAAEFDRLGGGLTQDAIDAAGAYGDELNRLRVTTDSLRAVLAVGLLPSLTWFVQQVRAGALVLHRLTAGTHVAKLALTAFGIAAVAMAGQVLIAWLPVLLPFIKIAAAVAAVILITDDFITLMQGGDSVIGRFLDSMFGIGTSQRFVQELRMAWEGLDVALGTLAVDLRILRTTFREWFEDLLAWSEDAPLRLANWFQRAWDSIGSTFGVTWEAIEGRVERLFGRVSQGLRAIGSVLGIGGAQAPGATPQAAAAAQPAPRQEGFFEGILAEYRNVFGGAGAPPGPATAVVPPRQPVVHRTSQTTLHVTGVQDPQRAADEVMRRLREQQRAERDADHPVQGGS